MDLRRLAVADRSRLTLVLCAALVGVLASSALAVAPAQELEALPVEYTTPLDFTPGGAGTGDGTVGDPAPTPPSAFTLLPDYVTPVKNQSVCGSCWAFASYGAMESNILIQGGSEQDFSENHLKNYHGFDWAPCEGGNHYMHQAYLSRLDGPVAEADDPYHAYDDRPSPGGPRQAFLRESVIYSSPETIKNAVMTVGALYTTMYYDSSYYHGGDDTYYYDGTAPINHAVAIVGWDDAKTVAGAPNTGAWLIRNSWGPAFGDNGYFWIAYDDAKACSFGTSFVAEAAHPATRCYYYDTFGYITSVNTPYGYNRFTAVADEELTAVGIYAMQDGAEYTVRIFDTVDGNNAPTGLLGSLTGTLAEGFHVLDLDSTIALSAGDDFVIYLYMENGGTHPLAVDLAIPGYNSASTANPGESFYSFDGLSWTDLVTEEGFETANFSIKAYTTPEPATMAFLGLGVAALLLVRRRWGRA